MSQVSPVTHRQNFDNLQPLSSGTYATVFRGGENIALKASSNLRMSAGLDGDVTRGSDDEERGGSLGDTAKFVLNRSELIEAMILRRFSDEKHPNVLSAGQIFFDSFVGRNQFSLILQLELANGSLDDFARKRPSEFKKPQRRIKLLGDIANGLAALHHLFGVCHSDLKPGNVLIQEDQDDTWHARLADFGISTFPTYAVHGHAAECYTFGHVPPECCNNFYQEPHLIRDTPEANAALCSFSCFAAPVSSFESTSAPPSSPSSVPRISALYCTETLSSSATPVQESNIAVAATPVASLAVTAVTLVTPPTPELLVAAPRPRQANSVFFDNVTRADFKSDIWAFGSLALFVTSLGMHPVIDYCLKLKRACRITAEENFRFQFDHRMQMTLWFKALRQHQKSSDWERVFDFDSVANHFSLLYAERMQLPLKPIDFESSLDVATASELDLIYSCLQFLPDQRLSVDQLCKHSFFNTALVEDEEGDQVGKKRRQQSVVLAEAKKLRGQKSPTLLSVAVKRANELGVAQRLIKMPFHQLVTNMLIEISRYFKFSYKSLLMANAYVHFSAHRILVDIDDAENSQSQWTKKNCLIHGVTCLLLAVSLFEPRHDGALEITDIVGKFGDQYEFTLAEIATCQRLLVDCIGFEFDIPTVATFIDLSLAATKTTSLMPAGLLMSKLLALLLDAESLFSCSQSISLALAFLKRFGCTDALDYLLLVSGHRRSSINATLALVE